MASDFSRLLAISDLHVNHRGQLDALRGLAPDPDAALILAGDVGDGPDDLDAALCVLAPRFAAVFWVPGNHELWARGQGGRGVTRYRNLVSVAREHGAITPECAFVRWTGPDGVQRVICPLFLLYDYSFAPVGMDVDGAVAWAAEQGIRATDEVLLDPHPYPSRQAWCAARVAATAARLDALPAGLPTILINHWPLRADLARLPLVPRYTPWCGTVATRDWHRRYRAEVVVSGHLHVRATDWRDGCRFEEVSLGYPRDWRFERGVGSYLRAILPGPPPPPGGDGGPVWRR